MLTALLLATFGSTFGSGVTVTLPVETKVKGTEIELGELALVAGLDGELVAKVRALELGYAPAPGFSRLLTAERIRAELAKSLPGVEVRVTGERACRVWPALEEIAPARVEEAARTELARAFAGKEATFTLKDVIAAVKVPLSEGESQIHARTPNGELASGIVGVPVEILVDGMRYRTLWTSWRVEVWETRPVLSRPVKAGEELRPELFERQRVKVGTEVGLEALQPVQIVGAVAKRDLEPGASVSAHDVLRPAAVTSGARLFLRVKKGSIEARVSATALETGSVGERIRVKTVEGLQELVATVIGRDLCEISL